MNLTNSELIDVKCFFRHISKSKKINSSVLKLDIYQQSFYEKITHYYGHVPPDFLATADNILKQTQKFIAKLIPLYQIGLRFDIYLVGGAIRDLLYGNNENIKDLDIVLSIDKESINTTFKNTPLMTIESILGVKINEFVNWNTDNNNAKVNNILKYCLQNHYLITKSITLEDICGKSSINPYDNIINNKLESLISLSSDNDIYPMDILLVNTDIEDYIKTFNFEICKAYVPLFESNSLQMLASSFEFLEEIHVTSGFIDDGMKNTITMHMEQQKSLASIEKSINEHYGRIKSKYLNHSLILNPGGNEEYKEWKAKHEAYLALQIALPKNEVTISSQPKKLKI
jgi:hypothetical protein